MIVRYVPAATVVPSVCCPSLDDCRSFVFYLTLSACGWASVSRDTRWDVHGSYCWRSDRGESVFDHVSNCRWRITLATSLFIIAVADSVKLEYGNWMSFCLTGVPPDDRIPRSQVHITYRQRDMQDVTMFWDFGVQHQKSRVHNQGVVWDGAPCQQRLVLEFVVTGMDKILMSKIVLSFA